jgi:hypothetical protein
MAHKHKYLTKSKHMLQHFMENWRKGHSSGILPTFKRTGLFRRTVFVVKNLHTKLARIFLMLFNDSASPTTVI